MTVVSDALTGDQHCGTWALALVRAPDIAGAPAVSAPPVERMFRYAWFLATEKRDAILREGRGEELDKLVAEARALQESVSGNATD